MGSLVSNYIWKNSKNLCATYFADMLLVGSELLKASRSFLSVWVSFFFFNCCLFYSFMCCFTVWLGFQSGSEYMLQSLYLMCKEKNHKSKKHSSVFSNDSLNHSEDEKADTFPFSAAEWKLSRFRFVWLLPHLSSFEFCSKTVGKGDIQLFSLTVQFMLFFGSHRFGYTCNPMYM